MSAQQALAPDGDAFGAAVEPALMDRLGLAVGDRFDIGAAHFVVRARIVAEPDRLATGIGFGPRVLMSEAALNASGLIQPGALIRWTTRVRLGAANAPPPDAATVDAFVGSAKAAFPQAGWEARSRANVSPDFARDLDRFGEFLTLVGLMSLVVGGVGVANAAQSFVERKLATLAILKALGASGGAAVALALAEFLAVTLIGIAAGLGDRRRDPLRRRRGIRRRAAAAACAGDLSARARARRALRPADRARLRRWPTRARP